MLEFVLGYDLDEFRKYYSRLAPPWGDLGAIEERIIKQDPSHLILWREGDEILGHAIWHESNTREHRKGTLVTKKIEYCWRG